MDKLTIILIVISAVFAVATVYFQYLFNVKEKSQYLYWLSFFRVVALFLLLLLVINPSIDKNNYKIIKPRLNLVIDASKSIAYSGNKAAVEQFLEVFENSNELRDKFELNYYTFGSKVQPLDSLTFSDNFTDISRVFSTISDIRSEGQELLVLVTDGNETAGSSNFQKNSKEIIYPVIVGDTTIYDDLSLDRLNVNPTTFLNNNAPVEIFINYTGNAAISKELSLFENKTKIASKIVELNGLQNASAVSFFIPALKEGKHYYSASIAALPNEKNIENNSKSFALNVIQEQTKILIVSDMVHPDIGMLKSSIESQKEREVTIKKTSDAFNSNEYDLVILYQPTQSFQSVIQVLNEREINYLLISGLATDWDFLNKIQSDYSRETISSKENFTAFFNENYSTFIVKPIGADRWPPVQNTYGKLKINQRFNTLFFQKTGSIKTNEPLLATLESGNQKIGLWMGENSWRWRMYSFKETDSHDLFDEFISNLIQYLSSKKQKNRLNISHKELFFANESAEFTASYLDDNLNFDSKAQIEITISKTDSDFKRNIPFIAFASTFKAAFSDLEEGTYNYTVKVLNEEISKSGSFKVAAYNLEEQFSASHWRKLQRIATETGGKLYFQNDAGKLISDLISDSKFKTVQVYQKEKTPLIEWQFLLVGIIVALGFEWFLRKYFGKI